MQTQFPKNPLTCYLVYFCVTNRLKRGLFSFDASFTHENQTKLVLGLQLPFFGCKQANHSAHILSLFCSQYFPQCSYLWKQSIKSNAINSPFSENLLHACELYLSRCHVFGKKKKSIKVWLDFFHWNIGYYTMKTNIIEPLNLSSLIHYVANCLLPYRHSGVHLRPCCQTLNCAENKRGEARKAGMKNWANDFCTCYFVLVSLLMCL